MYTTDISDLHHPKIYLYRRIVHAKIFIDKHYAEEIDLENISDEAYFSKFHFLRLFKKIYQKTPHQYLTSVRIEKAKLFLKDQMPVNEVCFAVGFNSIGSFTTLFKKLTGSTPSEYAVEQKNRQQEIEQRPLGHIPGCWAEMKGWNKKSNFEEAL
jgi:AraC-like DNA-binding protein